MRKTYFLLGAALMALSTACSSDNKFEQTNTLPMMMVVQSPGGEAVLSNSAITTVTDAYNVDNAKATFTSLVLPSGQTVNPEIINLRYGATEDMDQLAITSTPSSVATGFGGLTMQDFRLVVTTNNAAVRVKFTDGTSLFGVSHVLSYFSNTFVRKLDNIDGEPYETNEYTKNQYQFGFNIVKKTANLVVYNVAYDADNKSNLSLMYEDMPFTFNASNGVISIAPADEVVPVKYSNNVKGDKMPQYAASNMKCFIYGGFDLPSFIEFSTPTLKISSTLYEYGKLPNADDDKDKQ